jgi:hypothetical protein
MTSGHHRARVVGIGHRRAIGPGSAEHRKIAPRDFVDVARHGEGIARSQIGPTILAVIVCPFGVTAAKSCHAS